jgi:O-antigen/teichoic acid export membrane protein
VNHSRLLRNVLSAAGQTILQTGILFVAYRYLIDHLGIQRVGVWSVVLATTSVARVSELGLAGSVVRFVATHRAAGDAAAARATIQTAAIAVAAILAAVLVVLHPALHALIPRLLPHEGVADATSILAYALLSMWLSAVSSVWLAGLDAYLRSDLRAILVVASTCVFAATLPATVPTYGLVGLALSQVIQGVLMLLAGWVIVRRVVPHLPLLPVEWKYSRLREMVAYGANLQVMAIVMLLFDPTTKVLLARFGGLSATGYFELAQQLVTKARALIVESNRVVVPVIAGLQKGGAGALSFYTQNTRYLSFLVTPFFSILAAATPLISELWIGRLDRQFVTMVLSITAAWYINALTAPAYFAYLGQGNLGWLTFSHTIMGIGNVALGVILGPALGWTGVIAAFVISLSAGSLVPVWAFHREHGVPMRSMLHGSDIMMAAACTGAATLAILAYLSLVVGGDLWMKATVVLSSAAVIFAVMLRHPLGPDVLASIKSATSGRQAAL